MGRIRAIKESSHAITGRTVEQSSCSNQWLVKIIEKSQEAQRSDKSDIALKLN